jgi:hypothetical protein
MSKNDFSRRRRVAVLYYSASTKFVRAPLLLQQHLRFRIFSSSQKTTRPNGCQHEVVEIEQKEQNWHYRTTRYCMPLFTVSATKVLVLLHCKCIKQKEQVDMHAKGLVSLF